MAKTYTLGDLQHAIMSVLWERGEATVSQVHQDLLPDRGLAPTTVATMLVKLEKKGVVQHRKDGRRFIYRATVSEGEVRSSMIGELTQRLFDGSTAALVSHLLEGGSLDAQELEQLQALIAQHDTKEAF